MVTWVLEAFQNNGILLKAEKSKLFQTQIDYLGFNISCQGINVKSTYMQKIKDWPTPSDLKSLESFLGFCSFYSSLIIKFSIKSFHMSELRKSFCNKKNHFLIVRAL